MKYVISYTQTLGTYDLPTVMMIKLLKYFSLDSINYYIYSCKFI